MSEGRKEDDFVKFGEANVPEQGSSHSRPSSIQQQEESAWKAMEIGAIGHSEDSISNSSSALPSLSAITAEENLVSAWKMSLRRCSRAVRTSANVVASVSKTLNPQQKTAAEANVSIPLAILAGAGTGKTTTLLGRVQHLLKSGAKAEQILILSFTNSSADDILERLVGTLGEKVARQIHCTTIHSFSLALIRCFYVGDDFATSTISVADKRAQFAILLEGWKWSMLEYEREKCRKWLQLDMSGPKDWSFIFKEFERQHPSFFLECLLQKEDDADVRVQTCKQRREIELELSFLYQSLFGQNCIMRQGYFQYGFFFFAEKNGECTDAVRWATTRAWRFKPGMHVPKGAVLVAAEILDSSSENIVLSIGSQLVNDIGRVVSKNQQVRARLHFEVPVMPPKGSPAALRAKENPKWRSLLARCLYKKLRELRDPDGFSRPSQAEQKPPKGCIKMLHQRIVTAKQFKHTSNDFVKTNQAGDVAFCFRFYKERMRLQGLVDFQDMLLIASKLLEEERIRNIVRSQVQHLLVDEFQDVSPVQLDVLQPLIGGGVERSFCAVGDDDQTVYTWNGSSSRIFEMLGNRCHRLQMIKLIDNYRSTDSILKVGRSFLNQNTCRIRKDLRAKAAWATNNDVARPLLIECGHPEDEADAIASEIETLQRTICDQNSVEPKDIAVLFRCFNFGTTKTYQALVQEFSRRRIPHYVIRETPLWERCYALDLLAYLHLACGEDSDSAFLRVLNTPPRGCGPMCSARLQERQEKAKEESQSKSLIEVAQEMLKEQAEPAVKSVSKLSCSTEHGLRTFLNLVQEMRDICSMLPVDEALATVAKVSGYSEWFSKQEKKRKRSDNETSDLEQEHDISERETEIDDMQSCSWESDNLLNNAIKDEVSNTKETMPSKIAELVDIARCFAESWLAKQALNMNGCVPGLFEICSRRLLAVNSFRHIAASLPANVLDRVTAKIGRGRLQIKDFLHQVCLDPKCSFSTSRRSRRCRRVSMPAKPGVCISTIHAAKGLEWQVVFIARWNEEVLPMSPSAVEELRQDGRLTRRVPQTFEKHEFMEEERRLAHVAATRAQKRLIITFVRSFSSKKNTAARLSSIPLPRPILTEGSEKAAIWKRVRARTAEEKFWDDRSEDDEELTPV